MRTFAQDAAFYRKVRVDETDDPGGIRHDGGDGCLTPNVQKVGEPDSRAALLPKSLHAL